MEEIVEQVPEATMPDLSPAGIRKMRSQYFTIRHIPLTCGHKLDVINQPRHSNCELCWWEWLKYHPQLVSTVDEAWREHGKEFVVRLRGRRFATMFARFQATVSDFQKQEKAKAAMDALATLGDGNGNDQQGVGNTSTEEGKGGTDFDFGANVQGGETESSALRGEVTN